VESAPDKGTTVRAFLPHVPPANAPEAETAEDASSGTVTILMVEDDAAVRMSTRAMLVRMGFSVIDVDTPSAALSVARNHPGHLDLLLTDIMLPELPGTRLADLVHELRPGIPVVRMSGYAGTVDLIKDPGAREAFIQKPFNADTLARAIREALAR
jgi:two-component system cell cycle sensor histidine kinase/response regulator CckA